MVFSRQARVDAAADWIASRPVVPDSPVAEGDPAEEADGIGEVAESRRRGQGEHQGQAQGKAAGRGQGIGRRADHQG